MKKICKDCPERQDCIDGIVTECRIGNREARTCMDYKKLAEDLLSYCHLNCTACEYAGDALECTIKQLASTAITELLARAEAAEQRCKELKARCKRLDEARERANEAATLWKLTRNAEKTSGKKALFHKFCYAKAMNGCII